MGWLSNTELYIDLCLKQHMWKYQKDDMTNWHPNFETQIFIGHILEYSEVLKHYDLDYPYVLTIYFTTLIMVVVMLWFIIQ